MTRAITVVLSGGGAKTAAHLGAVGALLEEGLVPTRYVATSMGAVLAAMLASGLGPDEVMGRLKTVRRKELFRFDLAGLVRGVFARSVLRPGPFRRRLARLLPAGSFGELPLPLSITATDLDDGALLVFGAGGVDVPLLDACCASAALPPFFPPFLVNGRRCADGGLRGVVPLEVASRFSADLVVAIDTGSGFDAEPGDAAPRAPALLQLQSDAQSILMAANTADQRALWECSVERPPLVWIRPRVRRSDTFALDRLDWYFTEGERAAHAVLTARHS